MITVDELRELQQKLKPNKVGTIADAFALLWLEQEHGLDRERALTQVAFGHSQELGVNGFFLDEKRGTLVLFICNATKRVSEFSDSLTQFTQHGISRLFARADGSVSSVLESIYDPAVARRYTNRFVRQLQSVIQESHGVIRALNIRLLFYGEVSSVEEAALFKNFGEDLLHHRQQIDQLFGDPPIDLTMSVKSADGSSSVPDKLSGYRQSVGIKNHVRYEGPDGELMHFGSISLIELLEMHQKLGIRFLSRNVRAALNAGTGSNQALSKAFREVAYGMSPPDLFLFRHNGVTLTASSCEPQSESLMLEEPQVLNGAQTITTLSRVCDELRVRDAYTKAVDERLRGISVLGRVITRASRAFVTTITIASNRQNPIMPWHLRAHDEVQTRLQAWFRDHLGIYYEVQEGAFRSMSEADLEWQGVIDSDKCLEIKKIAQTYLATDGHVDKMQKLKAVFEDDSIYSKTFHMGRFKAAAEDVVFCYKIDRRIKKMLELLGGPEKYSFAKGARSLIWALLCQAYLNDKRREKIGNEFGRDLVATTAFSDTVERFATARVKPLLSWIANESEYQEDVRAERYGFLNSRKAFERTMSVARERWEWAHCRLGSAT